MDLLEAHRGRWRGSNAFRLLPTDPAAPAEMTVDVAPEAGGHLVSLRYAWSHPDDGDQQGLLVLWPGETPDALVGLWGDSWHQTPEPRTLVGLRSGTTAAVGYEYAEGWRWEVVVDAGDPEVLVVRMDNVELAGSTEVERYAAMSAVLSRVDGGG